MRSGVKARFTAILPETARLEVRPSKRVMPTVMGRKATISSVAGQLSRAVKADGKLSLVLADGSEIPGSLTHVAEVRARFG